MKFLTVWSTFHGIYVFNHEIKYFVTKYCIVNINMNFDTMKQCKNNLVMLQKAMQSNLVMLQSFVQNERELQSNIRIFCSFFLFFLFLHN